MGLPLLVGEAENRIRYLRVKDILKKLMNHFKKNVANNGLAHLPPKINRQDPEIQELLESIDYFLEKFNAVYSKINNPEVIIHAITLKTSKASCSIENIITTNDELYSALYSSRKKQPEAVKEVFSYKKGLLYGYQAISEGRSIDLQLINQIASRVNGHSIGVREGSVFIFSTKKGLIYTPPDNKLVIDNLLYNLVNYYNNDDNLNPIIKMAIAHYQFEAIHPYMDGNGRTGRILNDLYLYKKEIVPAPILLLSNAIDQTKDRYYEELKNLDKTNKWESWIQYNLVTVQIALTLNINLLLNIDKNVNHVANVLKAKNLPYKTRMAISEIIHFMPYSRTKDFCEELNLSLRESKEITNFLLSKKVLTPKKIKGKSVFENQKLTAILSEEPDVLRTNEVGY